MKLIRLTLAIPKMEKHEIEELESWIDSMCRYHLEDLGFDLVLRKYKHNVFVQSIEKWMRDGQDDKFITYSQLAAMFEAYIKSLPANDFVIAPFSEITRFYDNVHYAEFDSLLKTIRLETPQCHHQQWNPPA